MNLGSHSAIQLGSCHESPKTSATSPPRTTQTPARGQHSRPRPQQQTRGRGQREMNRLKFLGLGVNDRQQRHPDGKPALRAIPNRQPAKVLSGQLTAGKVPVQVTSPGSPAFPGLCRLIELRSRFRVLQTYPTSVAR